MPTKTARRGHNELLPGSVTSRTQINPAPGNTAPKGARPCCPALVKRKRKPRGARKIYSYTVWITVLSSNDLMEHTLSKSNVLKHSSQSVPRVSCSASLSLSLSLSFRSSAQWILLFSHSYEKCYTWLRLPYCIKALIMIKPYIKAITEAVAFTNNRISKSMRQTNKQNKYTIKSRACTGSAWSLH